jgi:hypothetical protein
VIAVRTISKEIISVTAARKVHKRKGTLFFVFYGSVIRTAVQIALTSTKKMKVTKIARPSNTKIKPAPNKGAAAGTDENMIIIKDKMRAISRPK